MSTSKNHYVYGLFDPRNHEMRYIGKTSQTLRDRFMEHMCPSSLKQNYPKNNWIKKLLVQNLKPYMCLLESFSSYEECRDGEIRLVKFFRPKGRITNLTDGGEGLIDSTGEIGRKISASRKGNPKAIAQLNAARELSRLATTGKKRSKEIVDNWMLKMADKRKCSEETKKKIGESNKGKIRTEAQRIALAKRMLGKTQSLETRLKKSIATKGKINLQNKHGELNRKLTDKQIKQIDNLRNSGMSALRVSKIIGCSESTVWRTYNKRLSYMKNLGESHGG